MAATVILVGALWSAMRLLAGVAAAAGPIAPGRLALANLFIAAGTLVLSAGGVLNSTVDAMNAFAISLVVGIAIIFVGFLITNAGGTASTRRLAEPEQWRPPVHDAA